MGLDIRHVKPCTRDEASEVLDYFVFEEINANQAFFQKFLHLLTEIEGEEAPVLFFSELGYQRKGMRRRFFEVFENDKLYFDKQDVMKAYEFVEGDSNYALEEVQFNFRKHFVENFIEGESVVFASW